MKPENVNPQNFNVKKIIYTSPDNYFSIAIGEGDGGNIYDKSQTRFAMRWNGKIDEHKGFPTSNGHPMWFQLPNELDEILKVLIEHSHISIKDK